MLDRLVIHGFGCVKHTELRLTPLHALVGPNDSGKSTILRAVQALLAPVDPLPEGSEIRAELGSTRVYRTGAPPVDGFALDAVGDDAPPVLFLRLDPDRMRQPSPLLPGLAAIGSRGDRLAGVYDAILNQHREAYDEIERRTRELFPMVRRLGLAVVGSAKELFVELHDRTRVTAGQFSEGLLYWLAFATLEHTLRGAVVLLEEPENGLHPARIAEVVRVLRKVSDHSQILLSTHSPLVLNELHPDEVSVVTRTAGEGTRVRRFSEIPNVDRMLGTFSLGELWLAYANGVDEAALFDPSAA
jgi:predicted ATPase